MPLLDERMWWPGAVDTPEERDGGKRQAEGEPEIYALRTAIATRLGRGPVARRPQSPSTQAQISGATIAASELML